VRLLKTAQDAEEELESRAPPGAGARGGAAAEPGDGAAEGEGEGPGVTAESVALLMETAERCSTKLREV
jgi:hypothetical protein